MCVCVCLVGAAEGEKKKNTSQWEGPMQKAGQELNSSRLAPPLTIGLVAHTQDDLRGAVVAGDHIGRHKEAGGGCPGQTKVQDLQCAVRLHHNVTGLQVLLRKNKPQHESDLE